MTAIDDRRQSLFDESVFEPGESASLAERVAYRFPQPPEEDRRAAIEYAIASPGQRTGDPTAVAGSSGKALPGRWQRITLAVVVVLIVAGAALAPRATVIAVASVIIAFYIIAMFERLLVFRAGLAAEIEFAGSGGSGPTPLRDAPRGPLPRIPDEMLPPYTVLMPAYDEPEVIDALVRATSLIDYPEDKLEILLLLEEDDERTLEVLVDEPLPSVVRVVLVPAEGPRTKPKACNYGLFFASGELVTIYDAEDRPDAGQLRAAVETFALSGKDLACLQARLHYHNPGQNLLTRWFTIEYTTWFAVFLPGLSRLRLPIPLGGTSNHMRTDYLRDVGAWDSFNVTEDAELGLRLSLRGLRTGVLESITLEEANSDTVNWVRQRSRWYKGYLQTWLEHFAAPGATIRELGWRSALSITMLVGATPLLAAVNMLTWLCTLAFLIGLPDKVESIFPAPIVYLGTGLTLVGNALIVYVGLLSVAKEEKGRFAIAALLYPLYWILMAIAAIKAVWQLLTRPTYWEKTAHGLDTAGGS